MAPHEYRRCRPNQGDGREKRKFLIEMVHFPADFGHFVSKSWLRLILGSFKPKGLATSHLEAEEGPKTLPFNVRGFGHRAKPKSFYLLDSM